MINDSINRFLGVLCYPLASMEAFRQDLIRDYVQAFRTPDNEKAKEIKRDLKNQLIGYIRRNYNIYSYDEIYLYLEKCYLYDVDKHTDALGLYCGMMRRMAKTLISHRDGKIVFKYWKNENDEEMFGGFAGNNKVTLFHSLSCHIPLDVIAIVYMINNQKKPDIGCLDYFYGNIEVADQQLARVLEAGVAENHLHKGVSRTFSSIWDSLMEPLTARKGRYFENIQFINDTQQQNKRIMFYILGCGIVRIYLALRMAGKDRYLREISDGNKITELIRDFQDGQLFDNRFEEECWDSKKSEKENGRENGRKITAFFVDLWDIVSKIVPEADLQEMLCTSIFGMDSDIHTLDENVFLYYALRTLYDREVDIDKEIIAGEQAGGDGKKNAGEKGNITETDRQNKIEAEIDVKQCIIQYLRVRNFLFHESVQQKTIKGLDYFQKEHYQVNSALNHANIKNFWKVALREQLQNRDLCKIEFRTSMSESYSKFKKDVVRFLKAYQEIVAEDYCSDGIPDKRIPQVGLVIHFLKREDEMIPEKCFYNSREDCSYFHFGQLQQSYWKQIEAFKQLREEESELSKYLVGIDAASLENATPVWVFAPIFERARDSSIDMIGRNRKDGNYMQSLGFTFHAGEDFRHILSGLRRIDEVVEHLKFHAGDRIGHGIALGMRPEKWRDQNPVIIIPQVEALENYLWAYDTLSKNYSDFKAAILTYMEKQIYELSGKIYGKDEGGIPVETLIDGYHKLFSTDIVLSSGDNFEVVEKNLCKKLCAGEPVKWSPMLVAAARHCKRFIKEMERPVHYEITEQDLMIIEELQKILKKKLGQRGIILEVNPSSNTAIADLDILEENQFYQINHVNNEQNVIVCINSDDPAVFNTNVSNELAYIYYGMLEQGISREAALLWIDRVRQNGINSSFIRHEESDAALFRKLEELINKI